ncbi:hypothetical protein IF1G_07159 [Cordyceps javanica]|uniref:Uncharacterized protein n=1 Tax=Cordyceps javanica TaxID=43265 RepID=A0A545UXT2_9HYPO|nr:hypothetical protein IF1G_07159 [Cordyceps javanica]
MGIACHCHLKWLPVTLGYPYSVQSPTYVLTLESKEFVFYFNSLIVTCQTIEAWGGADWCQIHISNGHGHGLLLTKTPNPRRFLQPRPLSGPRHLLCEAEESQTCHPLQSLSPVPLHFSMPAPSWLLQVSVVIQERCCVGGVSYGTAPESSSD